MNIKNNRGIALILIYLLITVLVIMVGAFFYLSTQSIKASQRRADFLKAFYAAESAIDVGLSNLPVQTVPATYNGNLGSPSNAEYLSVITAFDATQSTFDKWIITGTGFVPDNTTTPRLEVELQIVAEVITSDEFFDNALYSASNLTIKGDAYVIDGDVYYDEDGELDVTHPDNVTGDIDSGETVDFMTDIDYAAIRAMAQVQDVADAAYDHLIDFSDFSSSNLPTSFWYTRGDDGIDNDIDGTVDEADEWIPNVIYVEGTGDLNIAGTVTIGGFFVIVSGDCQIAGTLTLEGCMLVIDDVKVSGTIEATGGLWAGGVIDDEGGDKDGAFVNGNIELTFDQVFMDAVEGLSIVSGGGVRVISWQEIKRQVK